MLYGKTKKPANQAGKIYIRFLFWPSLIISIILSILLTILLNIIL